MLAQPNSSAVLGASMSRGLVYGLLLTHIPDSDFLVTRGSDEHAAASIPRQTLNNIGVLESQGSLACADVPHLDREIARGGGEDIFGRRVEENVSDLPGGVSVCYRW